MEIMVCKRVGRGNKYKWQLLVKEIVINNVHINVCMCVCMYVNVVGRGWNVIQLEWYIYS